MLLIICCEIKHFSFLHIPLNHHFLSICVDLLAEFHKQGLEVKLKVIAR